MCGIAGIFDINKSKHFDRVDLSRELLISISKRGRHATGYAYVEDGETVVEKADIPARDFVELAPMFVDAFEATPRTILLHARYATQGSPAVNMNNHPIYSKVSGMTLIHNGWLTNEKHILSKYRLKKDAEVDSETVLRLIEYFVLKKKKRIVTAIRLAMRELKGRFACALISEKYPDTMWLWRSDYPIAAFKAPGALIFASTEELLIAALRNADMLADGSVVNIPDFKVGVYTAKDGKLYHEFTDLKIRKTPVRKKRNDDQLSLTLKNWHESRSRAEAITARAKKADTGDPAIQPEQFECYRCHRDLYSVGGKVAFCQTCKSYRDVPNSDNPTAAAWEAWKEQGRKISLLETAAALKQSERAKKKGKLN